MTDKFNIHIPNSVKKSLKKIPIPWRDRMFNAIEMLQFDPFIGEKMFGKLQNKRKIRIWPYRIIYEVNIKKKTIIIVEAGHRGGVSYK